MDACNRNEFSEIPTISTDSLRTRESRDILINLISRGGELTYHVYKKHNAAQEAGGEGNAVYSSGEMT